MKIAIYQPRASYYVGGGEVVALEHARSLVARGHNVTLVTTKAPFIKESEYFAKFRTNNPELHVLYIQIPKSLAWIYKIPTGVSFYRWHLESLRVGQLALRYFDAHAFDVIALHGLVDAISVPENRKSVLHLHGYPAHLDQLQRACLDLPNRLVAVSQYIKQQWQLMAEMEQCAVATNGIQSEHFSPRESVHKRYDVLYIGRLIPVKGVDYLIEAVGRLARRAPEIRVAIAGTGPEENSLKALVKKKGLTKQIKFIGYVDSKLLPDLYNSAKMVVLPSYDREGILTTMLEASACGIPVITTTACSMTEFLKHGKNGLAVKPQNSVALSRAILDLYSNEKLRRRLGTAAREDIVRKWDWAYKIKPVEKIYEEVARRN